MQGNSSSEKQPQREGDAPSFPLSYGQQAMWFLYQMAPQSITYNIYTTVRISSELDLGAWHRAWQHIVERHSILRTTYTKRDGQPVQVVHPDQEVDVKVTDASSWSEDYLKKQILAEAECPYNLETGPVLRVHLFTRSAVERIQLLAMHHIAGDMWSFDILLDELRVLYAAEVKTLPQAYLQVVENSDISNSQRDNIRALPNLPYTDYVRWQTEMLASSKGEQLSAYWQKQLAGELPLLELPMDKPRPREQTYCGATQIIELDKELLQKLRQLSEAEGTSLYRILLATFFVLLYRYTGQEDIPVGSPMAGRWSREEFQGIVGYFSSTVVCRANLAGNPTFKEFLAQVSRTVSEAREHQDYPFPLLVKELSPDRDTSRHPLFQVFLTSQKHRWFSKAQKPPLEPGKTLLVMSPYVIEGHQRGAAFDLNLALIEAGSSFQLCWQYNTDLFDDSTIARQVRHFKTLLAGIVSNPEQRVSQLPLLTSAESYQLLVEWNETTKGTTSDKCIHHLFEEQVERSPDAIAVVFEDKQLTYLQLNQLANKIAHHLRTLGVGPEVLVGICVERSLQMVVGLLGILKAGGAYVPLDPEYPTERLSFMLQDAQVKVLLTQQRLVEKLPEEKAQFVYLDTDWHFISRSSEENPITGVQPTNLAYVIYTSGSTGQPKGVAMNHFSLGNLILWQLQNTTISSGAKTLQFASVSFDVSFQEMFSTWCSGGTLLLIADELRRDAFTLLGLLQEKAVERLFLPFVGLQQIAEVATDSELVTSHLREIITAGQQLQITPAISSWLSKLTDCTLHNHYGPSESHLATTFSLTNSVDNWPILPPIGRPIANTKIYILDSHLQPVPISVPGELYIGGAGVARGYLNRPELTQHKFIPNPFSTDGHSRLYKTGDLARYLPDGNIEYLGRIDNQVKVRGFRIELGEIEAVLSQHPYVRSAVAIAREDKSGVKHLFAYVLPDIKQPTSDELYFFLKQKLPDYMMPASFTFLQAFPLSPNGKVDRRALPIPDAGRPELSQTFVAPSTATEELLAEIWSEILGVEKIGIHDNFFDLGGHSLRVIQVVSRIRQTFDLEISVQHLFKNPTISKLIEVMAELAGSSEVIDEIAHTIREISQLSPEQVQAMLALARENG